MAEHSVLMEYRRCRGCTTCIKSCPTEAIRVRNGKAFILDERCIDCGKCIRVCPHKAIKSVADPMDRLDDFDFCVALPEPALYSQFQNLDDINIVLHGLLHIGFQKVYEVSRAAELLSDFAQQERRDGKEKPAPLISSSCPTVLRIVRTRFPRLIDHLTGMILPMELAAIMARREISVETGLSPERIGIFAIVPCSSKVTAAHRPEGMDHPVIDGAFAFRDIYLKLLTPMKELAQNAMPLRPLISAGITGLGWASCGGESATHQGERCVVVDGVENVIRMLEELEDGRITDADFVELNACTQGCVGGCFTVENPYTARMRTNELMSKLPVSMNRFFLHGEERAIAKFQQKIEHIPTLALDSNRVAAMRKHAKIQQFVAHLPGLHCGSCGAPSCQAFAEDVVLGRASEDDCIFKMRAKMQHMAGVASADEYIPAPFRARTDTKKESTQNETT